MKDNSKYTEEKTGGQVILDLLRKMTAAHQKKKRNDYYEFQSEGFYHRPRSLKKHRKGGN